MFSAVKVSASVDGATGISVVAVRLRLFRAHRRLREKLEDAARMKARRARVVRERRASSEREKFLPLRTATGFACGD